MLHGDETVVFADAGYRGVEKRPEAKARHPAVNWLVAIIPDKCRVLRDRPSDLIVNWIEQIKASVGAKAEHPFRVIKCQFGFRKVCYKSLSKHTHQLLVMFELSNLWMVRKRILQGRWGHRVRDLGKAERTYEQKRKYEIATPNPSDFAPPRLFSLSPLVNMRSAELPYPSAVFGKSFKRGLLAPQKAAFLCRCSCQGRATKLSYPIRCSIPTGFV